MAFCYKLSEKDGHLTFERFTSSFTVMNCPFLIYLLFYMFGCFGWMYVYVPCAYVVPKEVLKTIVS